jgi:hypothetical protein
MFLAPFCSAAEKPIASCAFFDDWSDVWIPVDPPWHLQSLLLPPRWV